MGWITLTLCAWPFSLSSTLLHSPLGIDPRKMRVVPEGRPTHILDDGELIQEMYG